MENSLTLVTYNIHHGLNKKAVIRNITKLAAQKTNLFCLQEVRIKQGTNFILDELLKKLGNEWRAEYLIEPESHNLGVCFLWNSVSIEATNFEPLLLPKYPRVYFYEKPFEKMSDNYPRPVQRAALVGEFILNGKILRIINVHLDWQGGFKHKDLQIKYIHSKLNNKTKPNYEIFCGDFNTVGFYGFSERRSKKVATLLGNNFENAFKNKMTTSHLQMLDHIYVKNMHIVRSKVFKYLGSDHFPLLAEIQPKDNVSEFI